MIGFEIEVVEGWIGREEDDRLELKGFEVLVERNGDGNTAGEDSKKAERELHLAGALEFWRKQTLCIQIELEVVLCVEMRYRADNSSGLVTIFII